MISRKFPFCYHSIHSFFFFSATNQWFVFLLFLGSECFYVKSHVHFFFPFLALNGLEFIFHGFWCLWGQNLLLEGCDFCDFIDLIC